MEILITVILILLAISIIYNNFKKSSKGGCNCGSCDSKCSKYVEK